MKFANYYFEGSELNNIGDNLQLLAVDYIYEQMGIKETDKIEINKNELPVYNGEYAVLPVSMPLVDYVPGGLAKRFSPKIIPVFLGLTMLRDFLYPEEVLYLMNYAPIGCRDERTLNTLRSNNIPAYLNGCITALLPKYKIDRTKLNKVFLVDIPKTLEKHIPQNLLKNAQRETHLRKGSNVNSKQIAIEQYKMYKEEASLIVTSLLHCSVPCMAAGIPVVLAKSGCSYRFGWLEKLLPVYTAEQFENINWNPTPCEYEKHKTRLLHNAITQINNAQQKYSDICEIGQFYESREKKSYIVDSFQCIREKIDALWQNNPPKTYSLWGMTQLAEQCVRYIEKNYPSIKLLNIYDKKQSVEFEGFVPKKPDEITGTSDDFIIVAAVAAIDSAKKHFKEIKLTEDKYAITEITV